MSKRGQWIYKYSLLLDYYNKYGNIDVPESYQINGIKLGAWLSTQRRAYKGVYPYKISDEQIELLNKLGMKWDYHKDVWEERYNLVLDYYHIYGNIDIPVNYTVNNINIGSWIKEQRRAYRGVGTSKITKEQIEKLNSIGMKWDIYKETWNYMYSLLLNYYHTYGDVNVPLTYEVNNVKLGLWLDTQKLAYRNNKTSKLTDEQILKLSSLGINWNPVVDKWNMKYELLKQYYLEHGNIDVPINYVINNIKLGSWLCTQRKAYKGYGPHKITQKQIEKLEKLGMKWDPHKDTWDEKYELLKQYYLKHGNIDVPLDCVFKGVKLGTWLNTQRIAYKKMNSYNITQDQIDKLDKLGMKWNFHKDRWEEYYDLLEDYKKIHGNIDVPQSYKVGRLNLGTWLCAQKNAYKGQSTTTITPEQTLKLIKIGIDWNVKETKKLNNEITSMIVYNMALKNRVNYVLNDLKLEGYNEIDSKETQKEIEKQMIKRIWR